MPHFQFIVLVCAGMLTIITVSFKLIGELMKKDDSGKMIKAACTDKFEKIESCFKEIEGGAQDRNNRILTLEIKFSELITRMTRIEGSIDKNAEMTRMIYDYMAKNYGNDDR